MPESSKPIEADSVERAVSAAERLVSRDRLAELCSAMVDHPSPTGGEAALAAHLAAELDRCGLEAGVQYLSDGMASAYGRLDGLDPSGSRSLLLYAPIDTVTVGSVADDVPWAGSTLRPDMRPRSTRDGDLIIGLGAQNPKGHGACIVAAVEAIAKAGIGLRHDLLVGLGAGGMPCNGRPASGGDGVNGTGRSGRPGPDGHGVGCRELVRLLQPGRAVIAKTGWAVSWEEVGLIWFTVDVAGSHTYVGSRHLLPYRNAIADAGHIVAGLERWFERWAARHRSGLVAPQGVVAAIEGGWPYMPAFTTALCRFHVDLRLSPRTSGRDAAQAFEAEVQRLAAEIGAEVTVQQTILIPGTTTDPDHPVITTTIAAWERLNGVPHAPITGLSGATDANILRAAGVPTARVGLPKVASDKLEVDFQLGMNAVDLTDMELLTRLLIRTAIGLCEAG